MGKSNRIRANRANEKINSFGVKVKKKNGMPSWAITLITIVLTVSLILGVAAILVTSNGVFGRMTTVVSSDNYKYNANMIAYMANSSYMNVVSNLGLGGDNSSMSSLISLDPTKPLDEQEFGKGSYDSIYFGSGFKGTWYDYFVDYAVSTAKTNLVYLEYATDPAHQIVLDSDELATVDKEVKVYEEYASKYGYPTANSFVAAQSGKGISLDDVRMCIEYQALADKVMAQLSTEITDSITDEDINKQYEDNKKDYNLVDYLYYNFQVTLDDAAKAVLDKSSYDETEFNTNKTKILAKYTEMIKESKKKATEVIEIADKAAKDASEAGKDASAVNQARIDAFIEYICNDAIEGAVDTAYGKQTIASNLKTADGELINKKFFTDFYKNTIMKDVVKEVLDGKTESVDVVDLTEKKDDSKETKADSKETEYVLAYGKKVPVDYAKTLNTIKSTAFSTVYSAKTSAVYEKITYIKPTTSDDGVETKNDVSEWAFDDITKVGDSKTVNENDGASSEIADITYDKRTDRKSYVKTYILTATQYKDTETAKDISYIVFSKEEDAKEAINALKADGTFNEEALKNVAAAHNLTVKEVDNYVEGQMYSTEFDNWLYADTTKAGSVNTTPLKVNSEYYVVRFNGDSDELWYIDVENAIFSERATAKEQEIVDAYSVGEVKNLKMVKFANPYEG